MTADVATDRRAAVLKALAEPARWRIVERLADEDLCVCHLVEDLELPQPLVSHHLKALRTAGVVEAERFRQWTYYRLVPDVLTQVADSIATQAETAGGAAHNRRPCC